MLAPHYRISCQNVSTSGGATLTFTVKVKRWKYASDGSITYESSEATIANQSGVATGTFSNASTEDNTANKWIGGHATITVTPSASTTGSAVLQMQTSTDGGTTWPTNGRGIMPLGGATWAASSTAVSWNVELS